MDTMDELFDDENVELESMRSGRRKVGQKNFSRLINKKDLSRFEMDELFM